MEAMIRTPKDTPTATPVLIPSLDSEDSLFIRLEAESAIEVDVEEISVDDREGIDGLAVTVSVTLSIVMSVSVCGSVSFVDSVTVTVTMLCELALAALERLSTPHSYKEYSLQSRRLRESNSSERFHASWETNSPCSSITIATRVISAAVCI